MFIMLTATRKFCQIHHPPNNPCKCSGVKVASRSDGASPASAFEYYEARVGEASVDHTPDQQRISVNEVCWIMVRV